MNFNDKLKFALHNINNSKSRSALTIIIVFVVSLLILVIGISCVSVAENANRLSIQYFDQEGSTYNIRSIDKQQGESDKYVQPMITKDDYKLIQELFLNNKSCDSMYSRVNNVGIMIVNDYKTMYLNEVYGYDYNFNFINSPYLNLIEGNIWSSADVGSNKIYINKSVNDEYLRNFGVSLKIGDTIQTKSNIYDSENQDSTSVNYNFQIAGIFTIEVPENSNQWYDNPSVIVDMNYIYNDMAKSFYPYNVTASYSPPDVPYSFTKIKNNIKSTVDELNTVLPTVLDEDGKMINRASNSLLEELSYTMIISLVIVGVGILLGFIVLLLSIGSVANTIMISIDKNRRFTGLMRAMGQKNKNVRSIVRLESMITICLGVLLSTILCYCFTPIFNSVLGGLFGSMFYLATEIGFVFKFVLPIYFPIGVAVIFILMAMLFSRTGIRKLEKMDVITVISEVG